MSTGAIIGVGVLFVMVCCSSSSAAMMMGGDDDKGSGTGGSGGSTGPTPVESVSGFTGSCDDLSGASEDVSASSLQQCGGKCRNDESSFKCVGFMWNGSTCKLYDNAWTTGVDICNDGWTAHRFNGIPQSDNFTSSYDDLSGSYSDITADVRECKVACQNKGSACGGFMHKDTKCRMYEDGSSTGVDIQSTGWTAYRK